MTEKLRRIYDDKESDLSILLKRINGLVSSWLKPPAVPVPSDRMPVSSYLIRIASPHRSPSRLNCATCLEPLRICLCNASHVTPTTTGCAYAWSRLEMFSVARPTAVRVDRKFLVDEDGGDGDEGAVETILSESIKTRPRYTPWAKDGVDADSWARAATVLSVDRSELIACAGSLLRTSP
jgi:hypothetical protein